jgi:hypothetical protein
MAEFNLLQSFPKLKRGNVQRDNNPDLRAISRLQGFDYYDGERKYGFGGYFYDGRWRKVAQLAQERYQLNDQSRILVDRSDKGFLVFDLKQILPFAAIYGIHCSAYSINHAMDGFGRFCKTHDERSTPLDAKFLEELARQSISPFLLMASPTDIPFKDGFFDTVISINSICNYPEVLCRKAIREIMRVTKDKGKNSYIHTDSWTTPEQKLALEKWVLLAETVPDKQGWARMYEQEGYEGDFGFIVFDEENF